MKCAWTNFLSVVPLSIRQDVDKRGREHLQELRLRIGQPVELIMHKERSFLSHNATTEDLQFVINTASRYSPWASTSSAKGYITASGGHRIGVCGECVIQNGKVTGFRYATSLCMRVARSFEGIAYHAPLTGSVLILGPPGCGKTTLLRELIRLRSENGAVAVVDERGELFPPGGVFESGCSTDILTGCSKAEGMEIALRTMSPKCIAVDEITAEEDCDALVSAAWCGVDLLATAHASSLSDLYQRKVYASLRNCDVFSQALILDQQKHWRLERMKVCT